MPKRPSPPTRSNIWSGLIPKSLQPAKKKKRGASSLPDHGLSVEIDETFLNIEVQLPFNETAAVKLLGIINSHLENNKPLPYNIREYLYRAFKAAIRAEPSNRSMVLSRSLGLNRGQQRPRKGDYEKIGILVENLLPTSKNVTEARNIVAQKTGLPLTVVRDYHREYLNDEKHFSEVKAIEMRHSTEKKKTSGG